MPATFGLGRLVATPAALAALSAVSQDPQTYLNRHAAGYWGEVDPEERHQNERALLDGSRLMPVYVAADQTRLWVITEAVGDNRCRAFTCVLLTSDHQKKVQAEFSIGRDRCVERVVAGGAEISNRITLVPVACQSTPVSKRSGTLDWRSIFAFVDACCKLVAEARQND